MTEARPTPTLPGDPPPPPAPSSLPPDPEAYDEVRNEHARKRGLAAPYIAGGRDPDPDAGRAEERRYLRWLLIMVVAIVLSGFILGILGNVFPIGG